MTSGDVKWFRTTAVEKGVCLVAHGLNNKPETMDGLISELNILGNHCLRVSLTGHGEDSEQKYSATHSRWLADLAYAYKHAKNAYPKLPINVLGYSLGCTVAVALQECTEVVFDKAIFIAPAWALRRITALVRPVRLLRKFRVPLFSLSNARYRRHTFPSPAMYDALFETVGEVRRLTQREKFIATPTLVVLSRKDLLIDYEGTLSWCASNGLQSWRIIETGGRSGEKGFGHALFDAESLGSEAWQELIGAIEAHLSS